MKKIVEFLFGKPYKKDGSFASKFFRFIYVAMAVFYFIMMTMLIVSTIMEPSTIVGLLVGAVFFHSFSGSFTMSSANSMD